MEKLKQFKVVIRPAVFDEILDLYAYVCEYSPSSAKKVRTELIKSMKSLQVLPERNPIFIGTLIPAGKFRKMVVLERYLIFYQVVGTEVHIHKVVDGRQDYEWLLENNA